MRPQEVESLAIHIACHAHSSCQTASNVTYMLRTCTYIHVYIVHCTVYILCVVPLCSGDCSLVLFSRGNSGSS